MSITYAVKSVRLQVYASIASPMALIFIQGHKRVSNVTSFNLQYLGQYLSYCIQTWHDDITVHDTYAPARFDDFDLHVWTQRVGKKRKIKRLIISTTKQATRIIKLVPRVNSFVRDLDFLNVYMD